MGIRFKKFVSYYKPYRKLFLALMGCALFTTAVTLVFPLCTRYITKNILEGDLKGALPEIYKTGALMLVLLAFQILSSTFVDYRGHAMGAMMERDMRRELFEHYQKLSFRFYDDRRVGELMSRITNDLLCLTELYHHGPEDIVIYFVRFAGAFVILLTINVKLTIAIFCFLPFMAVFAFYFGKKMKAASLVSKERIGDINSQVEDTLDGIRVVQSFVGEGTEQEKFDYSNNRFMESRKTIYWTEAFLYQGMTAFTQLITIAVIVFGGIGIVGASLDLADLITFLLYTAYLIEPIQKLLHVVTQYQEGIASFERFMDIMDIEPDIKDGQDAVLLDDVKGEVEFIGVGFRYQDHMDYVLKDISLKVEAGSYIALIGSSGVGKSTLCSLIPRFYEATEGEIRLDGRNINNICLASLRQNIGVVQQEVYLFAGTVWENIGYGRPGAGREEVIAAAKRANAHDFIMGLPKQYDTYIGQRGVKLSGGQRQRLSVARVFLKDPRILILDEATSALDNESEQVIKESLEELAKNRTTFVIAHRLSTIQNADRIYKLTEAGLVWQQAAE